jgi:hypothetical protein
MIEDRNPNEDFMCCWWLKKWIPGFYFVPKNVRISMNQHVCN